MFRHSQHILLNRFCALRVKQNAPQPILFLTEYQAGWHNQKINEKYTPLLDFISSFKGSSYSYKNLVIQLSFPLFCVVLPHQLLDPQI